jgi:hypothetical protein
MNKFLFNSPLSPLPPLFQFFNPLPLFYLWILSRTLLQTHNISIDLCNFLDEVGLARGPLQRSGRRVGVYLAVDHVLREHVVGHDGEGVFGGGYVDGERSGEGEHWTQVGECHASCCDVLWAVLRA